MFFPEGDSGIVYAIDAGLISYVGQASQQRKQKRHQLWGGVVYRFVEHQKLLIRLHHRTHTRKEDRYTILARSGKPQLELHLLAKVPLGDLSAFEAAYIAMRRSIANGTLVSAMRALAAPLRNMARMRYRLRARERPSLGTRRSRASIFDTVRRSLCVQDGGHFNAARVVQSSSRHKYGSTLSSIRDSQRHNIFSLKFVHVYFFYRRIFLGNRQGHLPVVGMPFIWFLIRYLAEPSCYVDWPALCAMSGCGLDFLYITFFRASTLAHDVRRARALSVIEAQLTHHGLPIPSEGICLVPTHSHLPSLRHLVSDTITYVGQYHPLYASYLWRHTRINVVRRIPWSQFLPNAHKVLRTYDPQILLHAPPEQLEAWRRGADM